METVGSNLLENNTQVHIIGSSLVQTMEAFVDKVKLFPGQDNLDIQTNNNITAKVKNVNWITKWQIGCNIKIYFEE